ncbi:DUF1648 domain-containing protein [Cellulomonas sp. ATA003]|uniref:DUF1648 domain-containing protein n=1 Tax=Cellulomonas sp. ATA003 TaxID=3073064 RepID=UPI002872B376|nr:DUF1648 domain-containing protein [Cellulomonas sp. ATA003]WNB85670.1 DUF1648 domain-containing protein [Cellulomonas sp. ATA003]
MTSTAVVAVAIAWSATVAPDQVPLHFGPGLDADRFGSRDELLLGMAGVAAGMVVLFGLLSVAVRHLPLDLVNVPHADHWKAAPHVPELRRRLAVDLLHLGAATLLLVAGVVVLTTQAALAGDGRLSPLAGVLLGAYLAYVLALCVWMATRRYRPPQDAVGAQGPHAGR